MVQQAYFGGIGAPGRRGIRSLFQALIGAFRRRALAARERRKLVREFRDLSDGQLDRVLRDFGITRAEYDVFLRRAPYSRHLLDRMLVRLGIEQREFQRDRLLMREIERQCTVCANQGKCRRWLAGGSDWRAYRRFCPNADAFDSLKGPPEPRVIVD
jgi:hypothetical protein